MDKQLGLLPGKICTWPYSPAKKNLFYWGWMISFLWIQSPALQAQVCEGDITLNSQAEVEAFDCKEVRGDLIISGEDIVDLSPLQGL
ncbi:MAG: hypothetical protein AAFU64_21040, partial [Bacteroidota bacterium]